MLLFLLPLLFNPFGMLIRWLPALYLASWPIIIQTLGRETLMTHTVVLILFILGCDITRKTMLKLIGFDLLSLPVGLALIIMATGTESGTLILSIVTPVFSTLLSVVEPLFLFLEIYLVLDMIKSFSKWISHHANIHDTESQDLDQWEPPLTRTSITVRALVIILTILSYLGVYLVIQESKNLLNLGESVPIQFNQAIAALVTLQLIALSATIYREEGILSQSALVCLASSLPIFIAAWSYYHLTETTRANSSWSSYFPFSLFGGGGKQDNFFQLDANNRFLDSRDDSPNFGVSGIKFAASSSGRAKYAAHGIDFGAFEEELSGIGSASGLDSVSKHLVLNFLRRLIMVINSLLGLPMDKLAKFYFGPDFWFILTSRLVCLVWWALQRGGDLSSSNGNSGQYNRNYRSRQQRRRLAADGDSEEDLLSSSGSSNSDSNSRSIIGKSVTLVRWLFRQLIHNKTIIKLLLVLVYAQMLMQQMDNREQLKNSSSAWQLLADPGEETMAPSASSASATTCCGRSAGSGMAQPPVDSSIGDPIAGLTNWFDCMWSSAKTCSSSGDKQTQQSILGSLRQLLWFLWNQLLAMGQIVASLILDMVEHLRDKLARIDVVAYAIHSLWIARWRSPIIQRLAQSILVQVYYIGSLVNLQHYHGEPDYLY